MPEEAMDSIDQRRHTRLKHPAKIRVFVAQNSEEYLATLRDFSESGLFLQCADAQIPEIGALIQVQTTEFPDAPIQTVKVMRVEPGKGFGVQFIYDVVMPASG
jgi:PilZ domain